MTQSSVHHSANIHPTAIIDPGAIISKDVIIGPYCVIGSQVVLKDGVILKSHVVIDGDTHIGEGTQVFPFAAIGTIPQDLKYNNESVQLRIGKFNRIREHVTMNPGTQGGGGLTKIGDHCLFMVATHVAHDCMIGNHVIMANNATLAGHVTVGDHAVIGGLSAVHQFVRIGTSAMIGGMSGVEADVIPYGLVMGERASLRGLNLIGLKRQGISHDEIREIQTLFQQIFHGEGDIQSRLTPIKNNHIGNAKAELLINFIQESMQNRGLTKPK